MTPYQIDVMLWYYARAEDHPDVLRDPPVFRPTMRYFIENDLVQFLHEAERDQSHPMTYALTPRGTAYVDALQRIPLPESHWLIRWPECVVKP